MHIDAYRKVTPDIEAEPVPAMDEHFANPVSNVSAASAFSNTSTIVAPGDFGRIVSTGSNPRLKQLALKLKR